MSDTKECISSLLDQNFKDFKIFLVDNGSGEEEAEELKKLYSKNPKLELIFNKENLGFTRGNNRVIEKLIDKYEYIALLNNDTVVDKQWLESLVKCAKETKSDIISSKMISYKNRDVMDNAGHIMLNTGEILPLGTREQIGTYCDRMKNFGACAGACLYSSKMLKEIGLFDEFFVTGYEDAELGVRAVLAGYKSIFEPKAVVYHKGSVSINKMRDIKYIVKIQTNIYYTFFKLTPFLLLILNTPLIIIRIIIIILVGIVAFRKGLYQSQIFSIKEVYKNKKAFILSRRSIKHKRKLNSLTILRLQRSFIPYYFNYFWNFIVKGKKTVFE